MRDEVNQLRESGTLELINGEDEVFNHVMSAIGPVGGRFEFHLDDVIVVPGDREEQDGREELERRIILEQWRHIRQAD